MGPIKDVSEQVVELCEVARKHMDTIGPLLREFLFHANGIAEKLDKLLDASLKSRGLDEDD